MSTYVDPLMQYGWKLRGLMQLSCHLFADTEDELHCMACRIKLKRGWFQQGSPGGGRGEDRFSLPHYDLTHKKRGLAIRAGAIKVTRREAVNIWRRHRRENKRRD